MYLTIDAHAQHFVLSYPLSFRCIITIYHAFRAHTNLIKNTSSSTFPLPLPFPTPYPHHHNRIYI